MVPALLARRHAEITSGAPATVPSAAAQVSRRRAAKRLATLSHQAWRELARDYRRPTNGITLTTSSFTGGVVPRILLVLNGTLERYAGGAGEARLEIWSRYCAPGTSLELGYLAESAGGAKHEFGTGRAAVEHAALYPRRCVEAEREGYDAVIMHCASDPGLYEARRLARIPVIGPGEATFHAGAALGRSIGVTVPSEKARAHHWRQVRDVAVADKVIGMEAFSEPLGDYATQDPGAMTEIYVEMARRLVERGADVICPMGLAIIPVRVSAAEVSERLGVPVLDPALLAVRLAETYAESAQGSLRGAMR